MSGEQRPKKTELPKRPTLKHAEGLIPHLYATYYEETEKYFAELVDQLQKLKFCDGTVEYFGCSEQGEASCYSECQWIIRFEQIKKKVLEALKP